jgi:hypothetical protein
MDRNAAVQQQLAIGNETAFAKAENPAVSAV